MNKIPLSSEAMAKRVAEELPDGSFVNLGIGLPTLVSNFVSSVVNTTAAAPSFSVDEFPAVQTPSG
ncbi:unnamed protein product [marine sediment metagenome]|uniref:Succinyl-CoA--3-ketoacid-CoA transferase n=1 Tax=marine sediment metagenome TaxID=412755 RepID=X1RCC9_9ZZZZ